MRTLLAGEFTTATAGDTAVDIYGKLEVQNGSGTWIDVAVAYGAGCITQATWGETIDTPVAQAAFMIVQQVGSKSGAPLMSASLLNRLDDHVTYSPFFEIGRLVRFSTATMPIGVALDTGEYRPGFWGRIDDVSSADAQAMLGPITLTCSDLGAWLMDLQIETDGIEYGAAVAAGSFVIGAVYTILTVGTTSFTAIGAASNTIGVIFTASGIGSGTGTANTNLETVLQNVINANLPSADPAVTVIKESASNFAVTSWKQGETKVLDALTTLVLNSVGEDFRYRFDASHVSQPMWFNPDRTRVTVDATFATGQYLLSTLDRSIANIRNAIKMPFTDTVALTSGFVESQSAPSIAAYRHRFALLPASAMLTTQAQAQTVTDAVVNDLSQAPATATATCPFYWFVQLFDRYTFKANARQYDQDQTLAVVGVQHTIVNGQGSTILTVAGNVVGAYAAWMRQIGAPPVLGELGNVQWTRSGGVVTVTWEQNAVTVEVWAASLVVANSSSPDWTPVTAAVAPLPFGATSFQVPDPTDGQITLVQLEPRHADLTAGVVRRLTITSGLQLPLVTIGSVVVSGSVVAIACSADTKAIGLKSTTRTWEYRTDGNSAVPDVMKIDTSGNAGIDANTADTYIITAYGDPVASITGATQVATRDIVVRNGASAPSATWSAVQGFAPAVAGGLDVTIKLLASAPEVTWTVKVLVQEIDVDADYVDVTASLVPAPTVPPTVLTTYTWTATRALDVSGPLVAVGINVRAELLDNLGGVQDTYTALISYYISPAG
jgi:hypothetical protein